MFFNNDINYLLYWGLTVGVRVGLSISLVFIIFYIYTRNKRPTVNIHRLDMIIVKAITDNNIENFKKALDIKLKNKPNDFNCTPGGNYLFYLVSVYEVDPVNYIYDRCSHEIVKNTNFYTIALDYLIEKNCDIDLKDSQGRTALFLASWRNCEYMVHLLLYRGADPNVKIDIFYNYRVFACLLFKENFELAAKLFSNTRIDFVALLDDLESFKTTFKDITTCSKIDKMSRFVTLFQRRKQAIYTLCDYRASRKTNHITCLNQIDENDLHDFIKHYLIKDF